MLCVAMVTCFSSLFSYMHDDYSYIKTQDSLYRVNPALLATGYILSKITLSDKYKKLKN